MVRIDFEKMGEETRREYERTQIARAECINNGSHIGKQEKVLPCYATGQGYYYVMQCSNCCYQYKRKMTKIESVEFIRRSKSRRTKAGVEEFC